MGLEANRSGLWRAALSGNASGAWPSGARQVNLFLGVDGGQSSTTALIGDETGRVIGIGRAGPVNHIGASEGRAKFLDAVSASLNAAAQQAGLRILEFESACLGFSGGPADKEALAREIVKAS